MPNFVQVSERYALYVTVLAGKAGGPLIYIDSQGHIHVVPTGPDSRRIEEELAAPVKELQAVMNKIVGIVEKAHAET
jgi:hypothetical protein